MIITTTDQAAQLLNVQRSIVKTGIAKKSTKVAKRSVTKRKKRKTKRRKKRR